LANQGDDVAQFDLGLLYNKGWGVPRDYVQAVRWYRRAADQGNADAQYNLGQSGNDAGVALKIVSVVRRRTFRPLRPSVDERLLPDVWFWE